MQTNNNNNFIGAYESKINSDHHHPNYHFNSSHDAFTNNKISSNNNNNNLSSNFDEFGYQWFARQRRNTIVAASMSSLSTPSQSAYVSPFLSSSNGNLRCNGAMLHQWDADGNGVGDGGSSERLPYSEFPSMKRFMKSSLDVESSKHGLPSGECFNNKLLDTAWFKVLLLNYTACCSTMR